MSNINLQDILSNIDISADWIGLREVNETTTYRVIRDGNPQHLSLPTLGCEGRARVFHTQVNPLAAKLDVVVLHECPGQQPCFAQNLEAVADAQD